MPIKTCLKNTRIYQVNYVREAIRKFSTSNTCSDIHEHMMAQETKTKVPEKAPVPPVESLISKMVGNLKKLQAFSFSDNLSIYVKPENTPNPVEAIKPLKKMGFQSRVGFIGGGIMSQALALAFVNSDTVPVSNIMANTSSDRLRCWWTTNGIFTGTPNMVFENSDIVFLALDQSQYKTMVAELLAGGNTYKQSKLFISIMENVGVQEIHQEILKVVPAARVARPLPNVPVKMWRDWKDPGKFTAVTYSSECSYKDVDNVIRLVITAANYRMIREKLNNKLHTNDAEEYYVYETDIVQCREEQLFSAHKADTSNFKVSTQREKEKSNETFQFEFSSSF